MSEFLYFNCVSVKYRYWRSSNVAQSSSFLASTTVMLFESKGRDGEAAGNTFIAKSLKKNGLNKRIGIQIPSEARRGRRRQDEARTSATQSATSLKVKHLACDGQHSKTCDLVASSNFRLSGNSTRAKGSALNANVDDGRRKSAATSSSRLANGGDDIEVVLRAP